MKIHDYLSSGDTRLIFFLLINNLVQISDVHHEAKQRLADMLWVVTRIGEESQSIGEVFRGDREK